MVQLGGEVRKVSVKGLAFVIAWYMDNIRFYGYRSHFTCICLYGVCLYGIVGIVLGWYMGVSINGDTLK